MAVRLKQGVRLTDLCPQIVLAIFIVESILVSFGCLECVVTSLNDGKHSANSWHYKGRAVDFRTKFEILNGRETELRDRVREALGPDFDVVMEGVGTDNEHLHVEYDPK
jgi:hypothetical protein